MTTRGEAMKSDHFETLVSLLRHRASVTREQTAYTYLDDRFGSPRTFSWGEFDERARAMAAGLLTRSKPGDRALLVLPSGPDFLFAFFGCLYAGLIAVPAPEPARARDIDRLRGLIASAKPSVVLATRALLDAGDWNVPGVAPEEVPIDGAAGWSEPAIDGASTAFLQYTSGSTGDPKGVMVSHANILANEAIICRAFGHDSTTTVVGWLPHYHDMGLIGNILQPLFVGAQAVLVSPLAFMRDPLGWLRTVSKYRGRTTGGPNFAYELCVRRHQRLKQPLDIDLSCLDLAFVGAEPIRARTMQDFARIFGQYGFDERALFPCYGLAEATLFVTGGDKGVAPRLWERQVGNGPRSVFVGCGKPAGELDIRVVNPQTLAPCDEGVEGEVLVAGASVSRGYWNRPAETEATFGNRLPGSDAPFLRTGDLGVLRAGEVFITGRIRDCIIVKGQNYYPQDLEVIAEGVQGGIRAGHCAAFGFESLDLERIGLVCEVTDLAGGGAELCERIRATISDVHSVPVDTIVLIEPRSLSKTTSGKIERQSTKRAFLDGSLRAIAASSVLDTEEAWCRALDGVRVDRPAKP